MPKFNARKDQNGNLLLNLGYAFVTTKKPEMAQELIKRKRVTLPDGSDIEIKPISGTKRLTANENCKSKNFPKVHGNGSSSNSNNSYRSNVGAIGDGRGKKMAKFSSTDNFEKKFGQNQFGNSDSKFDNYSFGNQFDYPYGNNQFTRNTTKPQYPGLFNDVYTNDLFDNNANPLNNLHTAPASLNAPVSKGQQNSSSNSQNSLEMWPSYYNNSADTNKSSTSIFDQVKVLTSSDDESNSKIVNEQRLSGAPRSTRPKLLSQNSR
jgi:hypothetical protein